MIDIVNRSLHHGWMNEDITNLLSEISRLFRTEMRAASAVEEKEPTPFQNEVIAMVGRNSGIGILALAELAGRDKAQITRIIAELEALGLVVRERAASDRRLWQLMLTNAGETLFRQVHARRSALSAKMLSALAPHERDQLQAMLTKMRDALKCPDREAG